MFESTTTRFENNQLSQQLNKTFQFSKGFYFRKGDKNGIKEFYSGGDHKLPGIFFNSKYLLPY